MPIPDAALVLSRMCGRTIDEGMLRAEEIVMDTLYGKGRLKRR